MSAGRSRIYVRNLLANWFGLTVNLVVMFALSPYIVHKLGKTEYGIWNLLVSMTGFMGLMDIGIRASAGRHVILYTGRNEHQSVNDTLRTSLGAYSAVGVLLVAMAVVLGRLFPVLFPTAPGQYKDVAVLLLVLLSVNLWLTGFSAMFSSVLAAHERFDQVQVINLSSLALRTGGTVFALMKGYGMYGLAVALAGPQILEAAANFILARRVFPQMQVWPIFISKGRLRELMAYGIPAFLAGVPDRIIQYMDQFVVGAAIDVGVVAVYAIATTLIVNSWRYVEEIERTLFPSVQKWAAVDNQGALQDMCLKQIRMGLALGMPIYLGFIFFGREFIELWMGHEYADASYVLVVLSSAQLAALFTATLPSAMSATGHVKMNTWMVWTEAALNLGLTLLMVLVFHWGVLGVAGGTLAAVVCVRTILYRHMALRMLRISEGRYFRHVLVRGVASGALMAAACLVVKRVFPAGTWPLFAAKVLVVASACACIGWVAMVKDSERQRLRAWARRFLPPAGGGG